MGKVVAEYDYYTIEQAKIVIRAQKREEFLNGLVIAVGMIGVPALMFLWWFFFGY